MTKSSQSEILKKTMKKVDVLDTSSLPLKKKPEKGPFLALVRIFPELNMEAWNTLGEDSLFKGWLPVEVKESQLKPQALSKLIALALNNLSFQKEEEKATPCFVHANEKHFLFFGTE